MPDGMTMTVSGPAADAAEGPDLGYDSSVERTAGSHLTLSAIGHVRQLGADDSETGLAPTYMWYRKGRGETEFKLVGADGNLAAGTASKLEIDLTADDDGADALCLHCPDGGTLVLGWNLLHALTGKAAVVNAAA